MNDSRVGFMRILEEEFRLATGLRDRSAYKIYYGQVHPAPILVLGINPGGSPADISADGTVESGGGKASSSAGYFENWEHDVLDCDWAENKGLRRLLMPLVGDDPGRFRREVVKTNLAFRRSRRISDIDREAAFAEARPFLELIIAEVAPAVIILTGAKLEDFVRLMAEDSQPLVPAERDPKIGHVVFAANKTRLRGGTHEVLVVQVAHASQFSWTYDRYDISARIVELLDGRSAVLPGRTT